MVFGSDSLVSVPMAAFKILIKDEQNFSSLKISSPEIMSNIQESFGGLAFQTAILSYCHETDVEQQQKFIFTEPY